MKNTSRFIYNPAFFEMLCRGLEASIPDFDHRDFIFRVFNNEWPDLELKERASRVAIAMHRYIPNSSAAAEILLTVSKQLEKKLNKSQTHALMLLIREYIEIFGKDAGEAFLPELVQLNKYMRTCLDRYPDESDFKPESNFKKHTPEKWLAAAAISF